MYSHIVQRSLKISCEMFVFILIMDLMIPAKPPRICVNHFQDFYLQQAAIETVLPADKMVGLVPAESSV